MRKIFISYRRTEEYATGALCRELQDRYGEDQVFRDKEGIDGGESWKRRVLAEIDHRSALLVFIGREWADMRDKQGRRRLDDPEDPVRLELVDGITDGALIIPMLLENAQMPGVAELPHELHGFAELIALKLRDSDWRHDLEKLFRLLEKAGFEPRAAVHAPQVDGAALELAPARRAAASSRSRGAPIKLIFSYVIVAALLIGATGQTDSQTHWGLFLLGVGSVVLAVMSYRDYRQGRSTFAWPATAAIVLASILSVMQIGRANMAQVQAQSGSGNEPLNLAGTWRDSNGAATEFYQRGDLVTTVGSFNGLRCDGTGRLIGNGVSLDISVNGVKYAVMKVTVEPNGQDMSGTLVVDHVGTWPVTLMRR